MYYAGRLFELEREPALCWNDAVIVTGGSHLLFVQVVSPLSVLLVLTRVNFRFFFVWYFFWLSRTLLDMSCNQNSRKEKKKQQQIIIAINNRIEINQMIIKNQRS
jgi:hypothetical protein